MLVVSLPLLPAGLTRPRRLHGDVTLGRKAVGHRIFAVLRDLLSDLRIAYLVQTLLRSVFAARDLRRATPAVGSVTGDLHPISSTASSALALHTGGPLLAADEASTIRSVRTVT